MRDEPSMPPDRPRPVADAPVGELADGVAVAKGWLLALLASHPLSEATDVPVTAFVREAPGLVAAVLAALASDFELERLAGGGDLEPVAARAGALAGAGESPAVVAAVDLLRARAWRELMAELRAPDAHLVADLAERLAHVCGVVAQAALGAAPSRPAAEPAPAATQPLGAVLAVELDECERLMAAEPGNEGEELLARTEDALASALGPNDELVHLGVGRYRVMVRDADASGSHALVDRIATAIATAGAPHGTPLTVSIGLAVRGRDGDDAGALAAHAELQLFAVRAAGTRATPVAPSTRP